MGSHERLRGAVARAVAYAVIAVFLSMVLTATVVGPALLECGAPGQLLPGPDLFFSGAPTGSCLSSNIGWLPGMPLHPLAAFGLSMVLVVVARVALARVAAMPRGPRGPRAD